MALAVFGLSDFVGSLFGNEVVARCVVKEKMLWNDIDVGSGLGQVNQPGGRIVVVNVDHEARVRIEPQICAPVR